MRFLITVALTSVATSPVLASEVNIAIDVPRLTVAEYHRPYIAFWLENADGSRIKTLAVWYDVKHKDGEGTKWLKDMRQWWRRAGRDSTMPADGISSPTRAPGVHQISFDGGAKPLSDLPPGNYSLIVEAAREVGGREALRIPFEWPPKAPIKLDAKGESELGTLTLNLAP